MKKLFLTLIITVFLTSLVTAQDTLITSFFPYQPGDVLIYRVTQDLDRYPDSKITFVGDSVGENGDRYFFIEHEGNFPISTGFKVDTAGNVYAANWWEFHEYWKVLDVSKNINEPWIAFKYSEGYELGNTKEVFSNELFGVSSEVKTVKIYSSEDSLSTWGYERNATKWKSGIGIIEKISSELGPTYTLKAALIDGTVYGDTTLVITSVDPALDIPKSTTLYQNYPNPFNPFTTIKYSLNEPGFVKMELYTIHGQMVRELISEYKMEGPHSFILDGSNLSSGVYILRWQVHDHTEFIPMSLIK